MKQKVFDFIKNNNLIKNEIVICAVSGGVDSVCLLHILYSLGFNVVLAHVNHNKRKESIIEQQSMIEYADSLGIPFELLDYHYDGKDNFHNDAHIARYNFFKSLCERYHTNVIATAHHLDDQIETILIKLLEGSNLYGYGGISICKKEDNYKIIRPFLCTNKKEIYSYAKENNLRFFEDSSNEEDDFLRNRLRHHILPLLEEECEDIHNKFKQFSIQAKEAFQYIRKQSIDYLKITNNSIDLESFNSLDIALKKDIISLLFEYFNIRKNTSLILDIMNILVSNEGTRQLTLENGYIFIREYKKAYIKKSSNIEEFCYSMGIDEEIVVLNKYKFYFSKKLPKNNAKYINLCYNSLELPFEIRSYKYGDSIHLQVGSKKVNRIFIDNKVPKDLRKLTPIILDKNNNILWVYNFAKSKEVSYQKNRGDIYFVCEEL